MPSRRDWQRSRARQRLGELHPPPPPSALGVLPPSERQLRYIAVLAKGNGVEIPTPDTMAEASLLIQRLLAARGMR
jgi:hypothetical protein